MATFPGKRISRVRHGTLKLTSVVPVVFPGKRIGGFYNPTFGAVSDLIAKLTTGGRVLNARSLVEGLAFKATAFAVGTGGYYPTEPTKATPVNVGDTGLQAEVFRKAFSGIEHPIPETTTLYCRLEKGEAPYALGELGIFVTILESPLVPAEEGSVHLYSLVHFPIDAHNFSKVCAWRVSHTY